VSNRGSLRFGSEPPTKSLAFVLETHGSLLVYYGFLFLSLHDVTVKCHFIVFLGSIFFQKIDLTNHFFLGEFMDALGFLGFDIFGIKT
jgi:hypothetical protein